MRYLGILNRKFSSSICLLLVKMTEQVGLEGFQLVEKVWSMFHPLWTWDISFAKILLIHLFASAMRYLLVYFSERNCLLMKISSVASYGLENWRTQINNFIKVVTIIKISNYLDRNNETKRKYLFLVVYVLYVTEQFM